VETEVFAKLIPNYKNNKEIALEKRSVMYWADELDKMPVYLFFVARKTNQ
jgi:hypothetical protein